MALKGNAVIGQSGGPTVVINQSLVGAVLEARNHQGIDHFYGALHGVQGILDQNFADLSAELLDNLERIATTPSAALGSVRKKPTEDECLEIFRILRAHDVRFFFYVGGNDSAETAHIVQTVADAESYDLRVFHIPKTIDNDLLVNDHCPGYGSAAKFVAMACMGDGLDNRAIPGVKIDVIMGRHAGFLTAASALGRRDETDAPHLIYLPEVPFAEDKFLSDVENVLTRHPNCLVAVSEGIADKDGKPVLQSKEVDSHGNVQLSGTGALGDHLAGLVKSGLKLSRVRADTFGYLQRSFPATYSEVDAREAREVGAHAVRAAAKEEAQSGSIAIRRLASGAEYQSETFITPLDTVAKHTKSFDAEFINGDGNHITDAFREYALPLLGKLPEIGRIQAPRVKAI
jgi:6-phosphofructokinase